MNVHCQYVLKSALSVAACFVASCATELDGAGAAPELGDGFELPAEAQFLRCGWA